MAKAATPRKPRSTSKKGSTADVVEMVSLFANQLRFVSIAQNKSEASAPYAEHCMIANKWLLAFNGVLLAGTPIAEEIQAVPHTLTLRRAIERAGSAYAMTIEGNRLTVKSGRLRITVPTLDPALMPNMAPDECKWPLTSAVIQAMRAASAFAKDGAPTVTMASIMLTNGTVAGTDNSVMLEFNHGNQMPELCVPKDFATAVIKADKELMGFGYTPGVSVTFWFTDWSFIKTQLYSEGWPENWRNVLPVTLENPRPLPDTFWQAYDNIADFSIDDNIRYGDGLAYSHKHVAEGATYELPDEAYGWTLHVNRLKMIRPYIQQIGHIKPGVLGFFGENVRGAITLNTERPVGYETPEANVNDQPQGGVEQQQSTEQPTHQPTGTWGAVS